jgi:hypothetical protein
LIQTIQVALIAIAAPFVVGLPITLLAAQLCGEGKSTSRAVWLIAPLVGVTAIILIAQNLLYLNVRIPHSAIVIWLIAGTGWITVLSWRKVRDALRPIPYAILGGGVAIYVLHGLGFFLSGTENYYGYGWADLYNYVAQAQLFLDYPYHTDDTAHQFIRVAHYFKEDRIGQSVLHAFIAASAGVDAQYSFGPTIVLGPFLLFFVVHLLAIRLSLCSPCIWAGSFIAAALPAVATVHLECFMSQAVAMPLLAAWPLAIMWLFERPNALRVTAAGMLFAVILAVYSEIGVAALAIPILHILYETVRSQGSSIQARMASAGLGAKTLGAVLGVSVLSNPYFIASAIAIFGRVGGLNVLAGIYPWAYTAEGFARLWFGGSAAALPVAMLRAAGYLGGFLVAFGIVGLVWNHWRTRNDLGLLLAAVAAFPLAPALIGGTNYSYQFYKLLLTVSPLHVLGVVSLLSIGLAKLPAFSWIATGAMLTGGALVSTCTGVMTYASSLPDTTALSGRGWAHMLLASDTKEIQRYLRSLVNKTVVVLWYDGETKGLWLNAWLGYFAKHHIVWSMNYGRPNSSQFVPNSTPRPELSPSTPAFVVTWKKVPVLERKLVKAIGRYYIIKSTNPRNWRY